MSSPTPTAMPRATRRRTVVGAALGTALLAAVSVPTRAHDSYGVVEPPQLVERGTTELAELMRGRITALQLMFTSCSATCPIQGAVFAEMQQRLRSAPRDFRLLSLSIDPLGDDLKALRAWLQRFGADPARWTAAVIAPEHVDALFDCRRARARASDRHTPQVYLFDRQARLVYRTLDMPPASSVVSLMEQVSQRYP